MYPLLYNYVGDSRREGTATEQPVSLVASKPSSHVILKEMLPGLEENVHRFILQFQCKSEGTHYWASMEAANSFQMFTSLLNPKPISI